MSESWTVIEKSANESLDPLEQHKEIQTSRIKWKKWKKKRCTTTRLIKQMSRNLQSRWSIQTNF